MDAISWFRTLPVWLDLPGLRVVHACWHDASREALVPFLDEAGRFTEQGYWRVTGTDQLLIPLSKYSSKARKRVCRRVSIFSTRMDIGGKRFGYVGGIKTQQRFERPPLGWTDGRMKYPTPDSRGTMGITKASQYSLGIIGSRTDRKSQRQMQRAWISALLRRAT
jgi:hypothetical protein